MILHGEVQIDAQSIRLNQEEKIAHTQENWLKEQYINLDIDYPKFYKMDVISKMAFIAVENLKKIGPEEWFLSENIAQILANKHASTFTDIQFIESYSNGKSPSPSLFVYTLPNIVTGELAIRNKWYGQNLFFILNQPDWIFLEQQIDLNLYDYKGFVVCGWSDVKDDLSTANATFKLFEL